MFPLSPPPLSTWITSISIKIHQKHHLLLEACPSRLGDLSILSSCCALWMLCHNLYVPHCSQQSIISMSACLNKLSFLKGGIVSFSSQCPHNVTYAVPGTWLVFNKYLWKNKQERRDREGNLKMREGREKNFSPLLSSSCPLRLKSILFSIFGETQCRDTA